MSLAVLLSRAQNGLTGIPVRVEVHLSSGLPAFNMVGLPDAGVKESRDRVRSALVSSGYTFPNGRITVNLAPADLPKASGRYDLPIALGVLLASGQLPEQVQGKAIEWSRFILAGELSLTGALVDVPSPLALALSVARESAGFTLVLPAPAAQLAAQVPGIAVWSADTLEQVVAHFSGGAPLVVAAPALVTYEQELALCLSDVRGQSQARRVLEVAASGGHSLLMSGCPGTGKSMLAQRLPGLLPLLGTEQALEVSALVGYARHSAPVFSSRPPLRSPHSTVTLPALIGGGSMPSPGEVTLAHNGVLFTDELPHFKRQVIEGLREPLEAGCVTIARTRSTVTFPARFQWVAAMNPCPCGWLGHPRALCRCTPEAITRYRSAISGPLLDRLDLHITLQPMPQGWMRLPKSETSAVVAERVVYSRQRQMQRQGKLNAALSVPELEQWCAVDSASDMLLEQAIERWNWSARVVHRVLRVARTLADMQGETGISKATLSEAMQYRQPWS